MKKNSLLILLVCFIFSGWSQNYNHIDNKVYAYPEFESIETLSKRIKSDFKSELNRVRAIFIWIANNIAYDLEASKKNRK